MNTRYALTLCTALVVGGALFTGSAHALGRPRWKHKDVTAHHA